MNTSELTFPAASQPFTADQSSSAAPRSSLPLPTVSRVQRRIGWSLTGFVCLFLALDGVMKLVAPAPIVEGSAALGVPPETLSGIGGVLLAGVALHLWKRTAVFGALILTGFLGGAVAIHVRVLNPWPSHVLFPVYLAVLLWAGLWLRDARLRALLANPH